MQWMPTGKASLVDAGRLLAIIDLQTAMARAALDVDYVMELVAARAAQLTGADAGAVAVAEGDEMVYRAASGPAAEHVGLRLRVDASLSGRTVREGVVQRCDDARTDDHIDGAAARTVGATSLLCVPLCHDGRALGVLTVYARAAAAFDDADAALLAPLASVVAAHMAHAVEFERRWFESRHDVLTGLGNRRCYDERLAKEVARAERYGHPLSLVLLDLDRFKAVNDSEGHPAGDEVLRSVGRVLRGVRSGDDCFRVGGDEFALLLPDTPAAGARVVADRVAAAIAAGGRVTASTGVVTWKSGDAQALHAAADADLLQVKRRRR